MLATLYAVAHVLLGMLQATFTPSNKLMQVEFTFDVMAFMQQLQRASGTNEFSIVPNTLAMAQQAYALATLLACT
jgi:hypothetical protein